MIRAPSAAPTVKNESKLKTEVEPSDAQKTAPSSSVEQPLRRATFSVALAQWTDLFYRRWDSLELGIYYSKNTTRQTP